MRRSSRIACFLGLSALLVAVAQVSVAQAGGSPAGQSGIGGARGLSPVRPFVGTSRGLSPIHPTVGAARGPAPASVDVRRGAERPWRRRLAAGSEAGGYGYGYAATDIGLGWTPGFGPVDQGYGPTSDQVSDRGPYPVIMAPPPPCVAPLIIRIGRSVRVDRQRDRTSGLARKRHVRVVYGVPGCGRP